MLLWPIGDGRCGTKIAGQHVIPAGRIIMVQGNLGRNGPPRLVHAINCLYATLFSIIRTA